MPVGRPSATASNVFVPAEATGTASVDGLSTPSPSGRLPFALLYVLYAPRSVGAGAENSSSAPSPIADASQRTENFGEARVTTATCPNAPDPAAIAGASGRPALRGAMRITAICPTSVNDACGWIAIP